MTEERLAELRSKVDFVIALSKPISNNFEHVNMITYEVYRHRANPDIIREYLVYCYKGGAILVRNCTGNSKSAILDEIAKYIYGGYYDEVPFYKYELPTEYERVM